jgi:uncharacterized protein (TIGR02466 family)
MHIDYFFSTSISSLKNIELSTQMLPVANKYLADKSFITNTWGYKNTYSADSGLSNFEDITPFRNFVEQTGYEYLTAIGYDVSDLKFSTQIFVSEMVEGDCHALHSHPNSLLSGVFYLQVPEGSAPILFDDPRPFRKFVALPKLDNSTNWERIHFVPEDGLFLMWESWLDHEVPKNNSKDGRITMVFNLGRILN